MREDIIEGAQEGTLWHAPPSSPTCFGQSDDEVRERYRAKRGQLDEDLVQEFGEEVLQGGEGRGGISGQTLGQGQEGHGSEGRRDRDRGEREAREGFSGQGLG